MVLRCVCTAERNTEPVGVVAGIETEGNVTVTTTGKRVVQVVVNAASVSAGIGSCGLAA